MSENNRCLYLDSEHNLTIENREIPKPEPNQVLVKVAANGICGSDIHFYLDGRLGNFVVTQPYIPGHEASGTIVACGSAARKFEEGTRVVIEPGVACGHCKLCKIGRYNLCPNVIFLSAPPVNGTFCDYLCIDENYVFPISDTLSFADAALAEPLVVAIHTANRARIRLGETGVIVGAGPIGLLMLQAFKSAGGGHAICIDLHSNRLDAAKKLGADEVIVPDSDCDLESIGDVIFETAGSSVATKQLFKMARVGGRVAQVGWPDGNIVELDVATFMEKELDYIGVNRYANGYETAVRWLADGRIKTDGIITQKYSLEDAPAAFKWAHEHPQDTIKVIVEN